MTLRALPIATMTGLAACASAQGTTDAAATEAAFSPDYLGIQTMLMEDDLVDLRVSMKGARDREDVADYARCAAAQYALIRGYGFARHVRTNVTHQGGVWRGDAVYTISAALPPGLKTIDAEVEVRDCGARGIPTV